MPSQTTTRLTSSTTPDGRTLNTTAAPANATTPTGRHETTALPATEVPTTTSAFTATAIPTERVTLIKQTLGISGVTKEEAMRGKVKLEAAIASTLGVSNSSVSIKNITANVNRRRMLNSGIFIHYTVQFSAEEKSTVNSVKQSMIPSTNFSTELQNHISKALSIPEHQLIIVAKEPVVEILVISKLPVSKVQENISPSPSTSYPFSRTTKAPPLETTTAPSLDPVFAGSENFTNSSFPCSCKSSHGKDVEYTDSFLLIAVTAFGLGGISAVGILLVYRGYTRSCAKRRMAKIVPTDVSNNEIVSETMKTSRRSLTSEEIVNQLEQQSKKDQREQEAQLNDRQEKIRSRIAQRLKKRKEAYEERLTNSKILQKIEIFQHLTDTTLARIIHKMELQTFPDGKKICKHGDVSDMFYVIMKGRVQVLIPQQDGLKHTLKEVAILKELQYFGETALLGTKQTRKATCVALDQCEVLALSREQFDHLVQSNLIGAATIVQLENAAATIKKKDEARKLTRLLSTKVSKLSVMQIKRAIIFAQEPDMSEEAKRSAALALAVSIKKYVTSGVREDTEPLSTAIALFVNIQQSLGEETDPKLYDTGKGPKASASRQPSAPPPRGPPPRGPPPQGPPLTEA